ncbi:hypothetical protein JOE59_002851 [Agromyces cerinus]|nr:hypothetical protein [Agromyces cerinus]
MDDILARDIATLAHEIDFAYADAETRSEAIRSGGAPV